MALDEESKKRIEEEESYRKKLREEEAYRNQIREKNKEKHNKRKSLGCLPAILIILVLWIVVSGIYNLLTQSPKQSNNTSTSSYTPKKDLDGSVNFDSLQVLITNNEKAVWTNCYFTINGDYRFPSNAPSMVTEDIQPGETFTIDISSFTKKDGERFNPYIYKNKDISASCDGRFGYWTW